MENLNGINLQFSHSTLTNESKELKAKEVYNFSNDIKETLDYLTVIKDISIKQLIEILECQCDNIVKYEIFHKNDERYVILFFGKILTTYFQQKCCSNQSREFSLNLNLPNHLEISNVIKQNKFSCCKKERIYHIKYLDGFKNYYIRERENSDFFYLEILDKNKKLKYYIEFPFCQLGFLCRNYCYQNYQIIGKIYEKNKIKTITGNNGIFHLFFPDNFDAWDKLNLSISILLFHYKFFSIDDNEACYYSKKFFLVLFVLLFIFLFIVIFKFGIKK
jgi:hypothetical protein